VNLMEANMLLSRSDKQTNGNRDKTERDVTLPNRGRHRYLPACLDVESEDRVSSESGQDAGAGAPGLDSETWDSNQSNAASVS
jgi:hypothetical protein